MKDCFTGSCDFKHLAAQFKLKQLVDKLTRSDRTLDLVLTNLSHLYGKNSAKILPPFGLSDHALIILHTKTRAAREKSRKKVISGRDTRAPRKRELGHYLCSINCNCSGNLSRQGVVTRNYSYSRSSSKLGSTSSCP